jgi:hypothetical protein
MRHDIVKTTALLLLLLAGSGCSGPSGGGTDADETGTGENKDGVWDKMKWDNDAWS